jgi:hypothetical protein
MKPHLFFFSLLFFLLAATSFASLQTEDFSRIHVGAKNRILPDFIGTKTPDSRSTCRVRTVYLRKHTSDSGVPSENGMNWTGYVGGNPVNMVDPTGYFTFENISPEEHWEMGQKFEKSYYAEQAKIFNRLSTAIDAYKKVLADPSDRCANEYRSRYAMSKNRAENVRKLKILTVFKNRFSNENKKPIYIKAGPKPIAWYSGTPRGGVTNTFNDNITMYGEEYNNQSITSLLHEVAHTVGSMYTWLGFGLGITNPVFSFSEYNAAPAMIDKLKSGEVGPATADETAKWLEKVIYDF